MIFNTTLLTTYKTLLQTTDLQLAYQEFSRFFRYLRDELEKQFPDCKFQSGISEKALDYTYFSFTNKRMKANGLKIVVLFNHKPFQMEVFISGYNRQYQCLWAKRLMANPPFELSLDPAHTDYIVRIPVELDISNGYNVAMLKKVIDQCMQLLNPYL